MQLHPLGRTGPKVSALGLGCMGMSDMYGPADRAESLATIAAVARLRPDVVNLIAVAKHPDQRRLARALGATHVVEPGEIRRAVRRATGSWILDQGQLTGGAAVVWDCVGSSDSIADALAVAAPGSTVVLAGMPGARRMTKSSDGA